MFSLKFSIRSLFIGVCVASLMIGLTLVTRRWYCAYAYARCVYGFPFPCADIPSFSAAPTKIYFVGLSADLAIGLMITMLISKLWTWFSASKLG